MKHGRLTRVLSRPDHGTFGVFTLEDEPFCVTLEPYGRNNEQGRSSISHGQYIGMPYNSQRFGPVYLLADVAGREMIEMHPGNTDQDTRGCIILAQHFGKLGQDFAVLNSGKTFKAFLKEMNHDKLFLTIVESY